MLRTLELESSEEFGLKQFQNEDLPKTKEDEAIVFMYGMAPSSQFRKMLTYFKSKIKISLISHPLRAISKFSSHCPS